MKAICTRAAVALTLVVLLAVLAGCGTAQTVVRTVTVGETTPSGAGADAGVATTDSVRAATTSAATHAAGVGDQISLSGAGGLQMGVTVEQVMDPLTVGEYDQADVGQRYVGVQITLKNLGDVAYSDSPSNGSTLLSASGEQADSQIVSGGPCGNEFGSRTNIAPGESQQGCIAFEMPQGESAGEFQFTLNSGFADQTGEWSLAGASSGPGTSPAPAGSQVSATPVAATSASTGTSNSAGDTSSGPAGTLQSHLEDLGSGQYQAAFDLTSSNYQSQNESWVQSRSAADPGVNVISIGRARYESGGAQIAVDFYARDRHPTTGSDTQCREFRGTASLVRQDGEWRYDPAGNSLTARVLSPSDPNCP